MKKVLFTLGLAIISLLGSAQGIEITPMGGYSFISNMNFYEGRVYMKDNPSYGIKIGFSPIEHSILEFSYRGTESEAWVQPYNSWIGDYTNAKFPININYFLISLQQERMLTNDKVYGFGSFGMGMSYMHPQGVNVSDLYSFAISVELGVKISITDRVGVRI